MKTYFPGFSLALALALATGLPCAAAPSGAAEIRSAFSAMMGGGDLGLLGWSRDGKVAIVASKDPGPAAPMSFYGLFIVDAVEDTILFTDWIGIDPDDPKTKTMDGILAIPQAVAFMDQAARSGIVAGTPSQPQGSMQAFPFTESGSVIDAGIVSAPKGKGDEDPYPDTNFSVWVSSSLKGKKTIATGEAPARDFAIEGFYRSPFEPRILVVYRYSSSGFEGDPNLITRYSGCNLAARFQ